MATLEVLTGAATGQRYEIGGGQTVLGRDPFCDIVLPLRSISRQHARIVSETAGFFIEDLHSLNGTFVNGRRIASRTRLKNHDQVQLYETLLAFYEGVPDPAPRVAAAVGATHEATMDAEAKEVQATMVANLHEQAELKEVAAGAKLQAVLEIIRNLGRSLEPDIFLPNVLDSLFEIFPQADRGYILLADPRDGLLVPQVVKHRRGEGGSSMTLGPISRSLATRVMTAGEAILSSDNAEEDASIMESGATSMMSVPIMGPSRKPLGILHLDSSDRQRRFVRDDLEVLWSVGAVTGQAVEYARIHEARLLLDRRERDLATAREVQLHFLPRSRPEVPGYQFCDYYLAAEDVGGDYFGYTILPDGRVAIAVGDVSGKGVSAALLMARLCSEVRYCLATSSSAVETVERLNRELTDATLNDRFVTFLLCVIDPRTNELQVVNAGHLPPLRRRATSVAKLGLTEAGPPLGLDPDRRYAAYTATLEESDTVVLYTDGISEARSPEDSTYGTHRLARVLVTGPTDVQPLLNQVLEDVGRFVGHVAQSDDICLVAFRRDPQASN